MSRSWRVVGDEHQKPDAGIGDGSDGDAGEQEDRDRGPPRAAGDAVKDRGRGQRARKGRERQQLGLKEAQRLAEARIGEDDCACGRQRTAAGDADQRGIGERVAKQSLHDGARRGEQAADHRGRRDPGNADRPQHELVARRHGVGGGVACETERSRQPGEGNAGRAHGQRDDGGGREDHQEQGNGNRRKSPSCARTSRAPRVRPDRHAHCRQFAADRADVKAPPSANAG
ncbi:hypothetical protein ACVWZ3_006919 [Bradyrhizobium sp. i1.3.6]